MNTLFEPDDIRLELSLESLRSVWNVLVKEDGEDSDEWRASERMARVMYRMAVDHKLPWYPCQSCHYYTPFFNGCCVMCMRYHLVRRGAQPVRCTCPCVQCGDGGRGHAFCENYDSERGGRFPCHKTGLDGCVPTAEGLAWLLDEGWALRPAGWQGYASTWWWRQGQDPEPAPVTGVTT